MDKQRESDLGFLATVAGMMKIASDGGVLGISKYVDPDDNYSMGVHMNVKTWNKYFDKADSKCFTKGSYDEYWIRHNGLWYFCLEDHKEETDDTDA